MQMQPTVSLFHKANQNKCLKQSSMFKMQIQALLQLLLLSHNQLKHAEILNFDLFWREMQGGGGGLSYNEWWLNLQMYLKCK